MSRPKICFLHFSAEAPSHHKKKQAAMYLLKMPSKISIDPPKATASMEIITLLSSDDSPDMELSKPLALAAMAVNPIIDHEFCVRWLKVFRVVFHSTPLQIIDFFRFVCVSEFKQRAIIISNQP